MKITFRKIRDGMADKVYVDGRFVGVVEVHSWPKTWKMKPNFHYNSKKYTGRVRKLYESVYKAGKALANLYDDTFNDIDGEEITDEYDMSELFKALGGNP